MENLILDFILFFVTALMKKYTIHATSAQGATQINYTSLEEVSKNYFKLKNLQQ